jgi:hypothetical protein
MCIWELGVGVVACKNMVAWEKEREVCTRISLIPLLCIYPRTLDDRVPS